MARRQHRRHERPPARGGDGATRCGLACAVTPSGGIELEDLPEGGGADMTAAARRRIVHAFEQGPGQGVLQLAVGELATELSPSLAYLRELGKRLVAAACRSLDPTTPQAVVIPEPRIPAQTSGHPGRPLGQTM